MGGSAELHRCVLSTAPPHEGMNACPLSLYPLYLLKLFPLLHSPFSVEILMIQRYQSP